MKAKATAPSRSIRNRIVAAYGWLAAALCCAFALVVFFSVRETQQNLLQDRLSAIAHWQTQLHRQGVQAPLPPGLSFHQGPAIPPLYAALPAGFSDLARGGTALLVLRGDADGQPFVAVDEIGDFEKIRRDILLALGLGIAGAVVLAIVLGRLTAGQVIAPLSRLAQAVQRNQLGNDPQQLLLDDEIGLLARALTAHTDELQQFLVRERLFVGDVSHELRTPLAVMLGAAEVLATRVADRPEAAAAAERIVRTARDTADRIGALLLLSRSPESLDAPPTLLRPLIEREIDRCRPLLVGKPVLLDLQAPVEVTVAARPELAAMAIGNLLRNACHYTEHGRVVVTLRGDSLSIEDTGPGLPAAVRAQLFERFVRGDSAQPPGAGLGLAIVKRICQHLRWEVQLQDAAGGGSRFVITFGGSARH